MNATGADRIQNSGAVILTSAGRGWQGIAAELLHISAGRTHVPGSGAHRLGIHFGRPVNADCQCDGQRHRRFQKHGDIDSIPAGLAGSWEDDADCMILRLSISPTLLDDANSISGSKYDVTSMRPLFQLRDTRIEAIAWAIKAELEADVPTDRLYAESLGVALATCVLDGRHRSLRATYRSSQTFTIRQQQLLLETIDVRLDQSLSLNDLASVVGLGVSHFKTLFRNTFGQPVHRYVIQRRVEHARSLILAGKLPLNQIALAAGFADQSHMANTMRRRLGLTPGAIARQRM